MNKKEYVDSKLSLYSKCFDVYFEQGNMPESLPNGDILVGYIITVIDSNPQINREDPIWKEVLKDDLLSFFSALLEVFYDIDENFNKENAFIEQFQHSEIDNQRSMWPIVFNHIKEKYSVIDVNIEGYIEQFKDNEVQIVIDALTNDWRKACSNFMDESKKNILEQNKEKWQVHIREYGRKDYECLKEIGNLFYRYPILQEIIRIIGRERAIRNCENDTVEYKYIPLLISKTIRMLEVEQISVSNDLSHVIPIEIATLSDPNTEDYFLKKYAEKQLQTFSNTPRNKAPDKKVQSEKEKPRLEMGPIIVSIDTSESMSGKYEQIAHSLLYQLLRLARKKQRKCFVITFSVRAKAIELTNNYNWKLLINFLKKGYKGGTNCEAMLSIALNSLENKDLSLADILIISDFVCPPPKESTRDKIEFARTNGTRFYGLQIGTRRNIYNDILDKIWKIELN